jgi:hypothetical protein
VTASSQEFPDDPDAPRLLLEQSGVWVYERPAALPRAWVVSQFEVMEDTAMLARIHEPDFDPRTTALVNSVPECGDIGVEGDNAVEILHDEGNRIEARVRGTGGLLIFSEVYYSGWRATVDHSPAQLVRADYLLRALCVPAGEHRVVLTYDPPLLKLGLAVTGLTLLSIVGAAAWATWQKRWSEGGGEV